MGSWVGRSRPTSSASPPSAILATVKGERLDEARHVRRKEVKAVTLHRLSVELDPPSARAILDI